MRKLLVTAAVFLGAVFGAALGFSGGLPLIPISPTYNEPSQLVATLNTLLQTLNGAPTSLNNNIPVIYSMGGYCTATGASPQTCNAQRGLVTTGTLTTAAATNANFVINNTLVTATSVCQAWVVSYSGTLVTNGYPVPLVSATGAGTLTVSLTNTHAANALNGTVGLGFVCIQ